MQESRTLLAEEEKDSGGGPGGGGGHRQEEGEEMSLQERERRALHAFYRATQGPPRTRVNALGVREIDQTQPYQGWTVHHGWYEDAKTAKMQDAVRARERRGREYDEAKGVKAKMSAWFKNAKAAASPSPGHTRGGHVHEQPLLHFVGVDLNPLTGRVQKIELENVGVKGELPEEDMVMGLPCLEVLDLRRNEVTRLPERSLHGWADSLRVLSVSFNRLESLPATLGCLRALERLNVDGNRLRTLPASIGNCRQLKYISACYNELYELPEEIGALGPTLEVLMLRGNRLLYLPRGLHELTGLNTLNIGCNPELQLPEDEFTRLFFVSLHRLEFLYADWDPFAKANADMALFLPCDVLWYA